MKTAALVPLKALSQAKHRLAEVLSADERRGLVRAMVQDVLAALRAARSIQHILVVSNEPTAHALARRFGARCVRESGGHGLNLAVTCGARLLADQGFERVLITHGDIPLLDGVEVDALLFNARSGICIASDARKQGTNLMVCAPPAAMPFHYDADSGASCAAHIGEAARSGVACSLWESSRMALDIDWPVDLHDLLHSPSLSGTFTGQYLLRSGIGERMGNRCVPESVALIE